MRHQQGRFLVAVSKTVLGVLQNDLGHDKKNIRVIPPGIEYSFNHDIHAKKQARLDWGLPLDGHCLLWVGNNATKKGLPSLLEALNQLSPNIFLVITGAASPENVWRLLVTKLQLEKRVYFKGVMEDMSIAYRAADLLVHPSLEDTFGMVVLEAMSHGVPAVVSDARYCGISADLEHQVNAWLLDKPQDPQALKHAIEISLEPSQHISLGQQALRWASSQNWNQLARTQESLYYDVVRLK
jgi:UDP-glucose:(heptosyl)LPS alpha-1,3-glucosyltransferase